MISIVVSSYKEEFFESFRKNVENTVGCEFEIIKIHNPGVMSIAKAYNTGRMHSKYNCMCFCHEDILFHTQDWGKILINLLEDSVIGCIGIAGTTFYGDAPGAWWDFGFQNYISNIIQHTKNGDVVHKNVGWQNIIDIDYKELAVVDGVFIASNRTNKLSFDESIPGFHAYDLAFSLQCYMRKLKVVATNKILIEHFSEGNITPDWYISTDIFYKKYSKLLPIGKSHNQKNKEQLKNIWIDFIAGCPQKKIRNEYWLKFLFKYPISKFNAWYFLNLFKNKQ